MSAVRPWTWGLPWTAWGAWLLALILLGLLSSGVGRTQELDRRVQKLEDDHADRRLVLIELRLDNIEFLGKGILLAVIGQLVLHGWELRATRPRS